MDFIYMYSNYELLVWLAADMIVILIIFKKKFLPIATHYGAIKMFGLR